MKILFVWTGHIGNIASDKKKDIKLKFNLRSSPRPLTFPILAALTPDKYSIDIVEADQNGIEYCNSYDIVGITCNTAYANFAYTIADQFRKKGSFVVLGGYHPSALPEEAKQHADSVIIGEAEETWPQFLKDFENGKTKPFYYPERAVDPSIIPFPRNIYPKGTSLVVQATRGCPIRCEFCAITNMKFRNIYRVRPIDDVVKEIELNSHKFFIFYDDSLTINIPYTKQLFRRIKDLNKRFIAYGNINLLGKNEELLKLARDAGCTSWMIGFESVLQDSLKSVGKKTNTVSNYCKYVKKIHDYSMSIFGAFIFGFDYDYLDVFEKTAGMVNQCEIDAPMGHVLTPLPGTPLYDRLEKEGRILTKDWSKYDLHHVVFKPKNMTPDELINGTWDLLDKWHTTPDTIKRLLKTMKYGKRPFISAYKNNFFLKKSLKKMQYKYN